MLVCTRGTSTVQFRVDCAIVQARHEALATLDHYTRGTSTVHTVQLYNHSTNTNTGSPIHCTRGTIQYTLCDGISTVRAQARVSRYITRVGMYKWHKHGISTNKISTSPVLATPNTVQVVHAQYRRARNTLVYYGRRPSHHVIYCTTHAYTYSRRVVQRSSCTRRPPYTNTHTHIHVHFSYCPSRTPYRTYTRGNVAHRPNKNSGRTPRPVGSTQTSPGPGRVRYTCVPHSHAQTNTHVRSCPGPVRVLYTRVPHSHAQIHTPVRPYVHGHRNPRAVRIQIGTTINNDTRGTARTFSANTTPSSDRDRPRGPDHAGSMRTPRVQIPQLEGEHEVVADLVIGYDLAMAQNQSKSTVDWVTLRMSATHTPAASA